MKSEDGQPCGSGLESSPLKARRSYKAGPVSPAAVLEDVKLRMSKPKIRLPTIAGNAETACFYTREILSTYLKNTSDNFYVCVC